MGLLQQYATWRVLLVEDVPMNQYVMLRILRRLGIEPDVASNGALATEACKKTAYDVVFMDLIMPEMDGLAATRAIRELDVTPSPYIIAVTAHAFAEDKEACMKAGMNDFLAKPITISLVAEALQRAEFARRPDILPEEERSP